MRKLLPNTKLWGIAGDIADRFHEKGSAEYDDLQEKMYKWIKMGIYKFL